jgi:hypothetical protein
MKSFTSALVILLLLGTPNEQANALRIQSGFSDEIMKQLADDI